MALGIGNGWGSSVRRKAWLQGPAGSGAGNGEHGGGFYGIWRFLVLDQRHVFLFAQGWRRRWTAQAICASLRFWLLLLSSLPLVYTTLEGRALDSCLARERRNPSSTHGRTTDTTPHQPVGTPWDRERVFLHRHLSNQTAPTWPGEEEPLGLGKDQFCETPTRLTTTPLPLSQRTAQPLIPRRHSFFNGLFLIRFWGAGPVIVERSHGQRPLGKQLSSRGAPTPNPVIDAAHHKLGRATDGSFHNKNIL